MSRGVRPIRRLVDGVVATADRNPAYRSTARSPKAIDQFDLTFVIGRPDKYPGLSGQ